MVMTISKAPKQKCASPFRVPGKQDQEPLQGHYPIGEGEEEEGGEEEIDDQEEEPVMKMFSQTQN